MIGKTSSLTVLCLALSLLLLAACTAPPATPVPTPVPLEPTSAVAPPPATQPAASATPAPAPTPVTRTGPASAKDWERVQAMGKLVAGTSADYAPYSYYNEDLKVDGFDPALIREIGKRLGVEVEIKDIAFDGLGSALDLGQIDTAIAAIRITPARAEKMAFTHPYYMGQDAILARPDYTGISIRVPENMAGMKVGVQKGSVYENWLQRALVETGLTPPENLVPYADVRQAMAALKNQQLDLVAMGYAPAQTYANAGEAKLVGRGTNSVPLGIASRFGSSLVPEMDNVLEQMMADGTVAKLAEQYLKVAAGEVVKPPEPTAVPASPTPEATTTPAPATATPVPACQPGMKWVQDLSYDDANHTAPPVVQPGQAFVKGWRVMNNGTCPWKPGYALVFVQGNVPAARMNGQPVVVKQAVPVDGMTDLSVSLTAPAAPGRYTAWWQMQTDEGLGFGERIWVDVVVPGPPTPVPPPQPPPPQPSTPPPYIANFWVNPTEIQQGQCLSLNWDVQGSISWVRILVNNGGRWDNLPTRGSLQDCPGGSGTYQYALEAGGPGGTSRQERSVLVKEQPPAQPKPKIDYFTPSTDRVRPGQCLDLTWGISGGSPDDIRLTRNGQEIMSDRNARRYTDCPSTPGTASYQLSASNGSGESHASLKIQVVQ